MTVARIAAVSALLSVLTPHVCAQPLIPSGVTPDVFEKAPMELAQLLQPSPAEEQDTPEEESAAPTDSEASESPADDSSFVFAGDLARTLRKIDPNAKVEWDTKKLRIRANGQEFAIFPTGQDMVVNGEIEAAGQPLKIRNGEIYVPQSVVNRIGKSLESTASAGDAATTAAATPTPTPAVTPTPTPEPTPEVTGTPVSILPDVTPAIATPTPKATETPGSLLPDMTTAPTPKATAAATAAPVTPATATATPFPRATPTQTPTPTPTPRPTATPTPRAEAAEETRPAELAASTEAFKTALRDKISLSSHEPAAFTQTQLQELASSRKVEKVVIHADDSGSAKSDKYGKESSKISLEIALKTKAQLEAAGMQVLMTRPSEAGIPVGDAVETISKSGAQVLLVISVGYSTSFEDLGGYRLFYMNESVDYHSLNPRTFDASEVVPPEYNYRPFQSASKVLVSSIKNSVSTALGNREPVGTNPVPDYLARRAPMAGATAVVGYLSNPADARRLVDGTQQDAMAAALAEGIRNYAAQLSQGQISADSTGGE